MKIRHLIILLLILTSCEEKIDWNFNNDNYNFIIVDGIITNKRKFHIIKITKPTKNLNDSSQAVSEAIVSVSDGNTIYYFTEEPKLTGIYKPDTTFIGVINKIYTLNIKYQDKEFTAQAQMQPVTPLEPLIYSLDSVKNLFHITYIVSDFNPYESAMYEINIHWSHLPEYQDSSFTATHAKIYCYTLSTLDINQIFKPAKEIIYFPKGAIIEETKYSLTTEHAKFIRSLLYETEWSGGYFDTEHGNIYTNLSEGAFGFFGACTVTSLTLTVK